MILWFNSVVEGHFQNLLHEKTRLSKPKRQHKNSSQTLFFQRAQVEKVRHISRASLGEKTNKPAGNEGSKCLSHTSRREASEPIEVDWSNEKWRPEFSKLPNTIGEKKHWFLLQTPKRCAIFCKERWGLGWSEWIFVSTKTSLFMLPNPVPKYFEVQFKLPDFCCWIWPLTLPSSHDGNYVRHSWKILPAASLFFRVILREIFGQLNRENPPFQTHFCLRGDAALLLTPDFLLKVIILSY